ncbi:MAG: TIGR00282 family metallophosphoesterase [Alphaproteobacteria bacterium]|nr:TIGR00282 family metallophosphoesterase [Alphaproteobacteria bacterium]
MRILFCGDIVGRAGRDVLVGNLPRVKRALALDFVIVNGENAAHGFGITEQIGRQLFEAGVDVITTGNHAWDRRESLSYYANEPRLLRPHNFPKGTPGRGAGVFKAGNGQNIMVANLMGRLFMDALDDPFAQLEELLNTHRLGANLAASVIDVHAEASSEKMALAHQADGRASLVVGTHSHVPTADAQRLPLGTAYQTDAGMCGDYDSVIGMQKQAAIQRFRTKLPGEKLTPAEGPGTLCGVFVETDARSGLALGVAPLRLGARLAPAWPDVAGARPLWATAAE